MYCGGVDAFSVWFIRIAFLGGPTFAMQSCPESNVTGSAGVPGYGGKVGRIKIVS